MAYYDSRNDCNAIIETATNTLIIGCKSTVIPSDVTSIGNYAFYGGGIISLDIPSSVKSIGTSAFEDCYELTNIILSPTLTQIPRCCFENCTNLKNIIIPEGVKIIEEFSFYHCEALSSVSLPSTTTSIGVDVFYKCNNLTSITVGMQNPITIDQDVFSNRTNATLYVPSGCIDAYKSATYWNEFKEIKETPAYVSGDANGDGKINVADYIAIAHHVMGKTPVSFNEKAADVNGDGKVNVADYIAVAHIVMNSQNKKPAELNKEE